MDFETLLRCPICKGAFSKENASLKCERRHSFDIASSGYVNLLKPGKMNNAKAGDSKEMIRARTSFLNTNAYLPIRTMICDICSELGANVIIDAGCGEGYYTEGIAKSNTCATVIGFDMSKFGCENGAKCAKRNGVKNVFYSVSSIFEMPLGDACADVIVNMFAPVANEEFLRVLKDGGYLVVASAGVKHLNGLKAVIYDEVYDNELKILDYAGFKLIECRNLKYDATIFGHDNIYNLFTMTPYFHRTSLNDKQKLDDVDEITTIIDVNFAIYKKQ